MDVSLLLVRLQLRVPQFEAAVSEFTVDIDVKAPLGAAWEQLVRSGSVRPTVREGVIWAVQAMELLLTRVSAHMQARFPATLWGRTTEWGFGHLWRGVARDREHARTDLHHLKRAQETRSAP